MNNPCYQCEKRRVGCHTDCEEYGAFKAQREEGRKKAYANKMAKDFSIDAVRKAQRRANRR